MPKNKITGIEKELIFEHLIDSCAPVTLIPQEFPSSQNSFALSFFIASKKEQLQYIHEKIVLLHDGNLAAYSELKALLYGKQIRVQFYYNRLALYFDSKAVKIQLPKSYSRQKAQTALGFILPDFINKVEDSLSEEKTAFTVTLFIQSPQGLLCTFDKRFPLFFKCDYKEQVSRFLREKEEEKTESIKGRIHAPKIIYIDCQRIVFASSKTDMSLSHGCEYALLLKFPLQGPCKNRNVYISCIINEIYENEHLNLVCACSRISVIQEEDRRFLSEMTLS